MSHTERYELRKFVSPEFIFGNGALQLAGRYAKNFGASKVLVVTDKGVIEAGWTEKVTRCLEEEDLSFIVFSKVTPNPRSEEVMQGAELYREAGCDVIIAIGGGSPIDCAKGIGIVSTNNRNVMCFEGVDQIPVPGPPLICIPTTAGSSADVSQFAIITEISAHRKVALVSKMRR
jgi:alcohol dehydrogenase